MAKKVSELPVAQIASDTDQYLVVQSAQSRKQTLAQIKTAILGGNVAALAGLTGAADRLAYFTGVGAMALTPLTAVARALLDDTTVAAQRTTLGLVLTTSAIDTTAGSVLKVGDFGVGATVAPMAASVDAIRFWASQQISSALATASGLPLNVGHMVTTMPGVSGTSAHQFASPLTSGAANKNRLWHRQCFSDVWTAWEEFAYGGVNASITSLTGLTTPLSAAQGGTGNATGLAATATALATSRSISTTGDATWTVNFNGTANATAAITLATSGVGAGTYGSVTVNAKGLVTAAAVATPIANGGTGQITQGAALTALLGASIVPAANGGTGLAAQSFANLSLQNSWTVVAARRAAYRKIMDNVQIELQITGGTAANGTLLFTLPVGFRPAFNQSIACLSGPNTPESSSVLGPYLTFATDGTCVCNNCSSAVGIYFSALIPLV